MFVFTLTACGGNNEDASADNSEEVTNEGTNENSDNEGENDEVEVEENTDSDETNENNEENADNEGNDGEAQAGGMITAGMYSAPGHQFNPIFYTDAYDANILDFTHEALVRQNESLEYVPHLAKEWEIDDDYTSITYYLNEGVKWHDGEEFTANDVYFTFASIADPDYIAAGGVRTEYVNKLVGYEDYVAGEADELVGIEVEDDYTVTFHFEEANITALYNTSFPIIPAHVFDEVAVADIPDHDASSRGGEVIGTGPYQLTEYIEGEQYVLTAHTDYWGGSPYLEGITWRVIEQSIMPGLLENGDLDMVAEPNGVPAADYERVDGLEQVNTFVTQDFGYQYMGIKHHHRTTEDVESGAINPDNWVENPKLQDERVRQAIVYALNREAMVDGLMHGMGTVLNAPFPEASWAYNADVVEQYNFDPDKANELLDEAGYEDVTGDGYREDPDGNEWTLNLDYPTGNEIRERTAPIIVDELGNVGIRVEMRNPREARAHFDLVEMDNTDWDLYLAGWSLATGDPDPFAIWETNQAYNYLRWNDETNDELIGKAVQAPEAFDQDYRTEVYYEWAQYVSEQVPQVFLYTSDNIYAYNASLKNVKELPTGIYQDSHLWYLEQ
ncbi:peptide ABC transporter substrate-binding protein [Salipaludibacillus keqinensis]|uniref:Peptide ABC transporter substrate-binding protein n=2 Tax=Salipaludibacillus keqinensis TaxID=2045207 RepID=A0A323TQF1_9BACI|nr:peptide ABC transporter substrate-binding protein [Salipaludibacillus keqinensis]